MHPMLNTAIKAARRAGTIINRGSLDLERLAVARKGPKDYVTEVDHAAEEAIIDIRSEEHTSELQSLMRISYAVFCLKKQKKTKKQTSLRKNQTITSNENRNQ